MSLTATMFGVEDVKPAGAGLVTIGALVVVSGPDISKPVFEKISFDVDLTQTVNQIQIALAVGIRAAVLAQFNLTIPSNNVNVLSFTKG